MWTDKLDKLVTAFKVEGLWSGYVAVTLYYGRKGESITLLMPECLLASFMRAAGVELDAIGCMMDRCEVLDRTDGYVPAAEAACDVDGDSDYSEVA